MFEGGCVVAILARAQKERVSLRRRREKALTFGLREREFVLW